MELSRSEQSLEPSKVISPFAQTRAEVLQKKPKGGKLFLIIGAWFIARGGRRSGGYKIIV